MENLMSIYLFWFLIGVSFLIAEFLIPSFVLFFFAIGAIIVSIITAFYDLSVNFQIILFVLFSLVSLLSLRNYMKNIFKGSEIKGKDKYFDNTTNVNKEIAVVSKTIHPAEFGEIKYKGTFYKAQSNVYIKRGKKVKVIGKRDQQGAYLVEEFIK
tara:strand:- start:205 stop:669 length:465 start_codon:yes stop_codon:yes gene_type:complete